MTSAFTQVAPQTVPQARDITELYGDIEAILDWTQDEIYDLEPAAAEALQLHWLRRRFNELRPQLKALDKLAGDLEIDEIKTMEDAIPLCFPHTMLKGYTVADIEKRRFDRLNRWLGTMTTHDLSGVDVTGVDSLDSWVSRLQAATPLEPQLSSGTSGKVSVQPKTMDEGRHLLMGMLRGFLPYRDEPGFDPRQGEATYISPWPARTGPHHITMKHTNMIRHVFGGNEDKVITLGQHKMTGDELWLSGRLRRAEALGEELQLTAGERELARQMAERAGQINSTAQMDTFIKRAVTQQAGQKVFLISSWQRVYELAMACRQRDVKPDYAPGSMFVVGGGAKNWVAPEGWRDMTQQTFPVHYIEEFAMSEFSAVSRLCSKGCWHVPTWGVIWVVDPRTGKPMLRSGIQTGRLACFDLLSKAYWAGTLSGDKVTVHWDGGCGCGRKGPYIDKDVRRFTEAEGGDDKISCSKTPDAYSNLVNFTLSEIDD